MKTKFYAVMHFLLTWLVRVIFLVFPKGNLRNEPRLNEGNYLVCANHLSAVDPIMICSALHRQQPRYMAKAELFKKPVLGPMIASLGAYPVDRSGADAGVLRKTVRMLESGCSVGMFPQGTRRPDVDPASTPVRGGAGLIAATAKVTVLPVYIKTKKNRVRWLRPVTVIVGKPMTYDEYTRGGELARDYAGITQAIFDRICALGREDCPEEYK